MEAIFLFFALAGVAMVIHWMMVNDKAGNRGVTTGFFAMRDEESLAEKAAAKAAMRAGKPGPNSPVRPVKPVIRPAIKQRRAF
jgi:hypothetical protein